jgi:hypothetical protein
MTSHNTEGPAKSNCMSGFSSESLLSSIFPSKVKAADGDNGDGTLLVVGAGAGDGAGGGDADGFDDLGALLDELGPVIYDAAPTAPTPARFWEDPEFGDGGNGSLAPAHTSALATTSGGSDVDVDADHDSSDGEQHSSSDGELSC